MRREQDPGSGAQWLEVSRGFSSLFWGMPAMALAHAAALAGLWPVRVMIGVAVASFLPVGHGLWRLRSAGELTGRWRRRTGQAAGLALATAYLSPFLVWWSVWPMEGFFAVQAGGHYLALVVLLVVLNRLAGEAARGLGDAALRREAKAGAGMVAGMSLCTVTALVWLFHRAGLLEAGVPTLLAQLSRLTGETRTLLLLPYAMTAYVMWRAKEAGFRRAVDRAESGSEPSVPDGGGEAG